MDSAKKVGRYALLALIYLPGLPFLVLGAAVMGVLALFDAIGVRLFGDEFSDLRL